MTKNLLVELGLEELPAYVVTPSEKQLCDKMAAFLDDNRLSYEGIQTFSTPRRLAVRVLRLNQPSQNSIHMNGHFLPCSSKNSCICEKL